MKIYLFILLFSFQLLFAQEKDIKVNYVQYFDTDSPVKRNAVLYANADFSLYEDFVKSIGDNTDLSIEEIILYGNNNIVIKPKIEFNDFIRLDKKNNQVFFFEQLQLDDYFLITDTKVFFDWKITQESKSIAGYKSYKAEAWFRGRKWIAWFTPELNYSFGPWKLYGLPGLILEAYDETRRYSFSAEQITFVKEPRLYIDFKELINVKFTTSTYKNFLDKQTEMRSNIIINDMRESEGSFTRSQITRNGRELKYEWEE